MKKLCWVALPKKHFLPCLLHGQRKAQTSSNVSNKLQSKNPLEDRVWANIFNSVLLLAPKKCTQGATLAVVILASCGSGGTLESDAKRAEQKREQLHSNSNSSSSRGRRRSWLGVGSDRQQHQHLVFHWWSPWSEVRQGATDCHSVLPSGIVYH